MKDPIKTIRDQLFCIKGESQTSEPDANLINDWLTQIEIELKKVETELKIKKLVDNFMESKIVKTNTL